MVQNIVLLCGMVLSALGTNADDKTIIIMSSIAGVLCAFISLTRAVVYFYLSVKTRSTKPLEKWLEESKNNKEEK